MNVKNELKPLYHLRKILQDQNGILFTSDLERLGIPRTYLSILVKNGEIERVFRGVYVSAHAMIDEMASLQSRYQRAIFSHETALYIQDLSDRTPLVFSVTVPTGYNATNLKDKGIKVYFVKRELFSLGVISVETPFGNTVRSYNLERTICDVLRSRNQMDSQLVNDAIKRYARNQNKNIVRLSNYAEQFHIQKIVRGTIEVLL